MWEREGGREGGKAATEKGGRALDHDNKIQNPCREEERNGRREGGK